MSSSRPPSSNSLDAGWGLFSDDPIPDAEGAEDDTRTVQMSSPLFKGAPSLDEGASDERDTLPPPVPVSEYVQRMMEQAADDPEPSPRPTAPPFTWHSAMPRSPAPDRRFESWSAPPATLQPPGDDEDDDQGGFTLIAFEPERLGDASGELDDPRFGQGARPAPDLDDLPFDDVIAASERAAAGPRHPTPLPAAPSSRGEPRHASIPPVLGTLWASAAPSHQPRDSEIAGGAPPTRRGLAASPADGRANAQTQSFRSIGDASMALDPSSAPRAPIATTRPAPPPTPADPFDDVRELYDAGDLRSALVMAEALLETEPDHPEALSCAASCRETLSRKYLSRLGGLAKILRVAMPPDEIRWLSLDHKAGFLLSCIDGTSTIEEVLDVACMQQFEAIRILHDFRELGVIEVLPEARSSRR